MPLFQLLRLTALCLFLTSCADKNTKPTPNKSPVQAVKKIIEPVISAPTIKPSTPNNITILPIWVEDHRLVNYISAIGTSKVKRWGGDQAQYNAAMEHARNNLSIAFEKHQSSLSSDSNDINIQQETISTLIFENAIVKEEWKHPETGQLYLWLVLPTF